MDACVPKWDSSSRASARACNRAGELLKKSACICLALCALSTKQYVPCFLSGSVGTLRVSSVRFVCGAHCGAHSGSLANPRGLDMRTLALSPRAFHSGSSVWCSCVPRHIVKKDQPPRDNMIAENRQKCVQYA